MGILDPGEDSVGGDGRLTCPGGPNDAYSPGERLYFELNPDDGVDRDAAREFWERTLGDDYVALCCDSEFIDSFARAAVELWCEVKDKL